MPARAFGCAADDLLLARRGQHPADAELVGIGVRMGLEHLADGEGGEAFGGVGDALDLEAEVGQRLGDLGQAGGGFEMLPEPGEGELHAVGTRIPMLAGRFRRSLREGKDPG
jgi:hypothetical protein